MGTNYRYVVQCNKGHKWQSLLGNMKKNGCNERQKQEKREVVKKRQLEAIIKMANLRGGYLVSSTRTIQKNKLKFMCVEGHSWRTSALSIKAGSWCPKCAKELSSKKRKARTLEKIRAKAKLNGGICLSAIYKEKIYK